MSFREAACFIALTTLCFSASAQTDLQSCSKLPTAEEKLACFEHLAEQEREEMADEFAEPSLIQSDRNAKPVTVEEARAELGAERLVEAEVEPENEATEPTKSAKQQAREGLTFTVVQTSVDGERRRILRMSDGQVWREIEPTQLFYPRNREFEVVINRGRVGDYRLRIGGKGPRARVTRLR